MGRPTTSPITSAWCFLPIAPASNGTTTTARWRDPARCRARANDLQAAELREREEIVVIEKFARIVVCAGMAGTVVAASALIVSGALAQEIRLTRSVASSAQSLLVDERSWDANCKPLAPSVPNTKQPQHGN